MLNALGLRLFIPLTHFPAVLNKTLQGLRVSIIDQSALVLPVGKSPQSHPEAGKRF